MDIEVVKIYVVCDDILQALGIVDDPQAQMTNAEVMRFAMIAGRQMHGKHQKARWLCSRLGYFKKVLSPSRLTSSTTSGPHRYMGFWTSEKPKSRSWGSNSGLSTLY
jgi:hypothetical protein